MSATATRLFTEAEWDFSTLDQVYKAIEDVALNELKLDVYPNQIEVISSEQMLDAYSSLAMPLMYNHWSFGKLFAREDAMYRAGYSALAYEIVINSSPCISYLLEENSMTMQALVTAHAAFGHNHFFKNNYLFRQWTNAESILDYLAFAKRYIAACEDRHGRDEVEAILDSAHALMDRHWSFGKRFAYHETLYRKGLQGLAYEIVINSNPVICYIMEENSMTMQTLVMEFSSMM